MVGQYRGQLWWDSIGDSYGGTVSGAAMVGQYRGSYGGTV